MATPWWSGDLLSSLNLPRYRCPPRLPRFGLHRLMQEAKELKCASGCSVVLFGNPMEPLKGLRGKPATRNLGDWLGLLVVQGCLHLMRVLIALLSSDAEDAGVCQPSKKRLNSGLAMLAPQIPQPHRNRTTIHLAERVHDGP